MFYFIAISTTASMSFYELFRQYNYEKHRCNPYDGIARDFPLSFRVELKLPLIENQAVSALVLNTNQSV